jgi:glyoxylase-like metal-dependent hydrolase (beta-lactamase superfamily II)
MHIHHLHGYIQSIYLIEYPEKLMLLDGCCRADVDMLKDFIENTLQRPLSDLKIVLVTHMHPDHAGAAATLRQLTQCKIVSADKSTHWYRGFQGRVMHLADLILTAWVAGRLGKPRKNLWYPANLEIDCKLNDGDSVPEFDDWFVLETPGHTDRDLSVVHRQSHRVYVADLIVKVKKRFISPFPVFYPNQYKASLKRIIEQQFTSIMLAHGGEVQLSADDYERLLKSAPNEPKTPWRATKARIKQMLSRSE